MPDGGPARQLSVDHSLASVMIAAGATRVEAESDPTAHTITRWLGADSFEPVADTATVSLDDSGWVVVCSDGLWNYASEAETIRDLLDTAVADGAAGPTEVAESLAATANLRGGHDNVTVLLARIEAEALAERGPVDEADEATIDHSDEGDESVEREG
jgi:serine/threonine protein phosphatase PrpC